MKVEVAGVPSGVTAIDMRRIGNLSGVKYGKWKQSCDYLLVCEFEGKDVAVFVELKKTLGPDQKKGMEQLRRSLPLLEYLRSICRIHHGVKTDNSGVDTRYFLIGEKISQRLDKQRVKSSRGLSTPTEKHEDITVNIFVGSRVRFDLLRSA